MRKRCLIKTSGCVGSLEWRRNGWFEQWSLDAELKLGLGSFVGFNSCPAVRGTRRAIVSREVSCKYAFGPRQPRREWFF